MIEFTNMQNYIDKKHIITIRFKDYTVKIPTVKEWLIINTIDFKNLNDNFREISKIITDIMLPDLDIEQISNIELVTVISECLKILSNKKDNESSEEGEHKESKKVKINFDYLLIKFCRYTNHTLQETLNLNCFEFFSALNGIEGLIAEESLRLAEIIDNHLYLKTKNGNESYKKTLDKYRETFKNFVNVEEEINFDGLLQLKAMLGGVK